MAADEPYSFEEDRAAQYDADIGRALPGYIGLHALVAATLAPKLQAKARILIVGAGTGTDIGPLAALPQCHKILACEPESAMALRGQEKFGDTCDGTEIQWHVGPLATAPAEMFDAVVMTLVMHFVPDDGAKAALWRHLAGRLTKGGHVAFVNLTLPETEAERLLFLNDWEQFNRLNGVTESECRGFFDQRIHALHMVSPERERELWQAEGLAALTMFRQELFLRATLLQKNP